ncbi:MAG TPA: HEAT repeat domain-containing protein [Planctomycetota bacterium]|jgi:HEAT repeat protein|nr:HEAT repeat domain-containing protein [Planctomycetota bacterium]
MAVALLIVLLLPGQDDPAQLIEGLRAPKVEDRIQAEQNLKKLGKKAVPALELARKDSDPEVSQRAERLLKIIPVLERLTPNLMQEIPGIEDRLALGMPHAWTEALVMAADRDEKGRRKRPKLQRADLDALVPQAFQAMKEEDLTTLCGIVEEEELRSAIPGLLNLIRQGKGFRLVQDALEILDAQEAVPDLVALLRSKEEGVRWNALWGLILLDAAATAPELRPLLKDEIEAIRRDAAFGLGRFGDKASLADLRAALQDEDVHLRRVAASALGSLQSKEAVPDLLKLLKAEDPMVRGAAASALADLRALETRPEILKLTRDQDKDVRVDAVTALADLGVTDSVDDLRALLNDEQVRPAAARALLRLGSRDGVPALLEAAEKGDVFSLVYLNALRRPEVWSGLQTKMLRRDLRGKPKDAAAAWAREAGMALDAIRGDERLTLRSYRGRTSLWHALWELSTREDNGLVFETDRIRNLPHKEALKFWKDWWASEQKK